MALMYQKVQGVITQPPASRPDALIEQIRPWFQKKSELFRKLQIDIMKDIIRNCEFLACERDDIIIRQGDKGDRFYIILSGQTSIYINNKLEDEKDGSTRENNKEQQEEESTLLNAKSLDRGAFGIFVTTLEEGKSFGEVALITEDCVRTASVIADTKTDLLVVSRELFNRCLRAAQEQEFNARMTFVNNCEYFCNWQPKYKRQLALSLTRKSVAFDEKLMKQGEPVKGIYFIIRGQVKLTMEPSAHWQQNSAVWKADCSFWTRVVRPNVERNLDGNRNQSSDVKAEGSRKLRRPLRRSIDVCICAPIEAVGDVEVSLETPSYLQTATAIEPCEAFLLTLRTFERLINRKYAKTAEMIKTQSLNKIERRMVRFEKADTPQFLQCLRWRLHVLNSRSPLTTFPCLRDKQFSPILVDTKLPQHISHRESRRNVSYGRRQTMNPNRIVSKNKVYANNTGGGGLVQLCEQSQQLCSKDGSTGRGVSGSASSDVQKMRFCSHEQTLRYNNIETRTPFQDWQTSDEALSVLEKKLKIWHMEIESKDRRPKRVFRLRRFSVDGSAPPFPGQKVLISYPKDTSRERNVEDEEMFDLLISNYNSTEQSTEESFDVCSDYITMKGDTNYPTPYRRSLEKNRGRSCIAEILQTDKGPVRMNYTKKDFQKLQTLLKGKQ